MRILPHASLVQHSTEPSFVLSLQNLSCVCETNVPQMSLDENTSQRWPEQMLHVRTAGLSHHMCKSLESKVRTHSENSVRGLVPLSFPRSQIQRVHSTILEEHIPRVIEEARGRAAARLPRGVAVLVPVRGALDAATRRRVEPRVDVLKRARPGHGQRRYEGAAAVDRPALCVPYRAPPAVVFGTPLSLHLLSQ